MKFNYGDTLRIRNELYTILAKFVTLILIGEFGISISWLNIRIMLSFGSVGMKNMMYISLQSYVAKQYHLI